jgi:uncharacterized glyoxalase superfamily protein PhnB
MMIPIQKNSVPYTAIGRLTRILFNIALRIGQKTTKDTFESLPGSLVFHLSEHSGDGTPGTKILVNTDSLDTLFNEVTATEYRHSKPSIETAPWGARVFEVTDPFSNRIVFNEQ